MKHRLWLVAWAIPDMKPSLQAFPILLSPLLKNLHRQPSFGQVTANGNQRIWALIEDVGVRGKFGEGRNAVYSIRMAWEAIIPVYFGLRDPWHRRRVLCPPILTFRGRFCRKLPERYAPHTQNRVEIIRLNSELRLEGAELHDASPVCGASSGPIYRGDRIELR
jgi:hypothetical protein